MLSSLQLEVKKQGPVDVLLPTLDKDSEIQTLIRCLRTPPNLNKRVELQADFRGLRDPYRQRASLPGFSTCHRIATMAGNQDAVYDSV